MTISRRYLYVGSVLQLVARGNVRSPAVSASDWLDVFCIDKNEVRSFIHFATQ